MLVGVALILFFSVCRRMGDLAAATGVPYTNATAAAAAAVEGTGRGVAGGAREAVLGKGATRAVVMVMVCTEEEEGGVMVVMKRVVVVVGTISGTTTSSPA